MSRYLVIVEVSQKQAYIFGKRDLRSNIQRSEDIAHATNSDENKNERTYFHDCCPDGYSDEKNLVYAGGGHTILQFPDYKSAEQFCQALTRKTLNTYPDMELFVKIMKFDEAKTVAENLNELTRQLEMKKARRQGSFRPLNFGVEKFEEKESDYQSPGYAPAGWTSSNDLKHIAGKENFIAIVHIDGNAMGARVQKIYEDFDSDGNNWDSCVSKLNLFSTQIDTHFQQAYMEMVDELGQRLIILDKSKPEPKKRWKNGIIPIRKIIGAGDDICFVTAGDLGIECAVSFIKHLEGKINAADNKGYHACAGVVMVHTKYPFRVAYDLSEELCSSAKRYGAVLCKENNLEEGSISLVDWHIEFGQMRGSLSQIRSIYQTEDGGQLELRPFIISGIQSPDLLPRTYGFFRDLTIEMMQSTDLPRSKVKQLRDSFKQGEWETELAMKQNSIVGITDKGVSARYPNLYKRMVHESFTPQQGAFYTDESEKYPKRRCLYYDSIEVFDHFTLWREEAK